jgi:hypothetical protein
MFKLCGSILRCMERSDGSVFLWSVKDRNTYCAVYSIGLCACKVKCGVMSYKEMSSILADQYRPRYMSPNAWGEGELRGLSQ